MSKVAGVNHVAIMTADLDRFVDFYVDVFDLEVVFREALPNGAHAILRTGPNSWLHPAQISGSAHGDGLPDMFQRGHLDHFAVVAASSDAFDELRERLVARNATDGSVDDLGPFRSLWFTDPDGMHAELTYIEDDQLLGIHAPTPATRTK